MKYAKTLLISLALMTSSHANESTNENTVEHIEQGVGVSTGAVIGSVVAGPPGAIAGAFLGGTISRSMHHEDQKLTLEIENRKLAKELSQSTHQMKVLQEDIAYKQRVLKNTHLTIERLITQNQELKNHALNFDVQFRTNSIDIEKQYQKYLIDLATALQTTPNMEVEVAGFSDRIGNEDYNMELSRQRALHVKMFLIKHGIEDQRITTLAHGESLPLHPENNLENNFFDRRVSVYLRPIEISTENIAKEIINLESNHEVASNLQNSKGS